MATEPIRDKINQILVAEFGVEPGKIVPAADLYSDLGLDSLDAIDLAVAVEKTFGFKVEEGALRRVRSVQDVCDFVAQRVS